MKSRNKRRLAVVGPGRYFQKLLPGIREHFDLVSCIDVPADDRIPDTLTDKLRRNRTEAVMILTPNRFHAQQACEALAIGIVPFVEKPLATTHEDLSALLAYVNKNPLLYCSDFYVDVRALPLRVWFGTPSDWARDLLVIEGETELWDEGAASLGKILEVEAVLLEGEGEAAGFEGREWLWDPVHGGVLWDLAYHYITLVYEIFQEDLRVIEAQLEPSELAPFIPAAETSACLRLRSTGGIPSVIRVAKYHPGRNQRWFTVKGTSGVATMTFARPNFLSIHCGSEICRITLTGDYYALVSLAFAKYLSGGSTSCHGLNSARVAVNTILSARATATKL